MQRATAVLILLLALTGGVLFDIVVPGNAPGIGIAALVLALLAASAAAAGREGVERMDRADLWLAPAAVAFALFLAVRSEPWLVAADFALAGATAGAAILALGGARITHGLVPAIAAWTLDGVLGALLGAGDVLRATQPERHHDAPLFAGSRQAFGRLAPVARGLVIAVPLVVVFVALFASADAVFAAVARTVIDWRPDLDLASVAERAVIVTVVAWGAAGTLAVGTGVAPQVFRAGAGTAGDLWPGDDDPEADVDADADAGAGRDEDALRPPPAPGWAGASATPWSPVAQASPAALPRLGTVEATTVLAVLDALFAAFVVLQVAYLFGGRDTLSAAGITYADYARRGFFELVAVAVIAGLVIVGFEVAVERRSRAQVGASLALLALTAVVLVSALARLRLYQDAYGWTELRFVVLVAIGWLGGAILVAGTLLARRRMRWFLHALGVLTVVAVAAMNIVGPAGFVAGENLARAVNPSLVPADGRAGFDADYLDALGDAAVPPAVAALGSLSKTDRDAVEQFLARRDEQLSGDPGLAGWPAWNLDRQQARDAIATWRARASSR